MENRNTQELLMKDYNTIDECISIADKSNKEQMETLYKEKNNIRSQMIQLETARNESKWKKIEILVGVGTFVITTSIGIWKVVKTFKFDSNGTITSTLGRSILMK